MSQTISIISCKGGVGKTTSAVNISSYIFTQDKRVLAVDLDYQHNLSKHFGILPGHLRNKPTMYDLFMAAMDDCADAEMSDLVHSAIRKSTTVDVLPATARLSLLDKVLPKEAMDDKYDYIGWWHYDAANEFTVRTEDNGRMWCLKKPEDLYDFIINECKCEVSK